MQAFMTNKAVIYARVSSKEQEDTGYSLDAQEKLLMEYAERKGYAVERVFRVSESASGKHVRQVFEEMFNFTGKHDVKIILCEKIDRLTRNLKDAALAHEWIQAEGRQIHFVKENSIINRDTRAHENLVWDMKVAIARFYTNNLSEEVKKGQREMFEQGWLPTKPPLGYKTTGEKGRKRHVIDEECAPLLKQMFEIYSTGENSIQRLTAIMYEKGLRTRGGSRLVRSRMADLLADPFYAGKVRWKGVVRDGAHEPLISRELFDRAQAVLKGKTVSKFRKHQYLFKGLVRCRNCKGLLTWERQKGIVYGHCNQYRACEKRRWYKESEFASHIAAEMDRLRLTNPRLAEWTRKALKELHGSEIEEKEQVMKGLQARQTRLAQRQDLLYGDRLDGRISTEEYDTRRGEIAKDQEVILEAIKQNSDADRNYYELGSSVFEISQRASQIFMTQTPEKQRRLLNLVTREIFVQDGNLVLEFSEAFYTLLQMVSKLNGSKMPSELLSPFKIFELSKESQISRKTSRINDQTRSLLRG